MNILVTGGAGFIGSHLSEALLERGHSVHSVDDLSTGSIKNIEHLKGSRGYAYTIGSIFDKALLAELVDWSDAVYHLAAAVGVRLIVEDPVRTIETNVHGTEMVLKLSSKKKRRVIVASTSEVYGKGPGGGPFSEGADLVFGATDRARWAYACSKAIDEFLALAYWRQKAVPTTVVRLFNTVGPRQTGQYGMVVPSLVTQAIRGDDMTVYGTGRQTRCFALVSEVVVAMTDLLECKPSLGKVVNLGSSEEVSILQLAKRIKTMTNSRSKIVFVPYDKAYEAGFEDMQRRVPDLSRARKLVGFRPKATLDDILKSVIDHIRAQRP
ncbi:MAG: nucleoside-diphosphate sugar epimerase [Acidobacteria bacterium]|nr:MAG: nucleoside-diphosphate sugar epimerase [Acidobacteriota bacterium]